MIELPRDLKDPLFPPWPHPASIYSGMQIMMSPSSPDSPCACLCLRVYPSTIFSTVPGDY
jgi:hypothetical protein